MNWSSGKDASLALLHLLENGYHVSHLLTTLSEEHDRVFMHGIREQLLEIQAERIGLPIVKVKLPASPDDNLYNEAMGRIMREFRSSGVQYAAYGDIFLEDLKNYREKQLASVGITGLFPLWKKDTRELVREVEQAGIEAIIVCVNEKYLGPEFLGRKVDAGLLAELPTGVDPCGENGEYHTFVYNAPFFSTPVEIVTGEIVHRSYKAENGGWDPGFYFLDVNPG